MVINKISVQLIKSALLSCLKFFQHVSTEPLILMWVRGPGHGHPISIHSLSFEEFLPFPHIPQKNPWHAVNAGSPQLCKEMHTHVRGSGFPWPATAGLERAQASQLLGSHYEITPVRNCTLIRYGRCCEYWCFFVVCEQLFPSLLLTVLPVPSVPVQAAVTFPLLFFMLFFFFIAKTHMLQPLLELFVTVSFGVAFC